MNAVIPSEAKDFTLLNRSRHGILHFVQDDGATNRFLTIYSA